MAPKGKIVIDHRKAVGGMWAEMGWFQFGYMVGAGLRPHHRLLDVGCGSLRGGRLFVNYLHKGNYYGLDKEQSLIEAGWHELGQAGLHDKNARLYVIRSFDLSPIPPAVEFDYALAQSVFTHLRPSMIRACLKAVVPRLKWTGKFYATYFQSGRADQGKAHPFRERERDIARYPFAFFDGLAQDVGARVRPIGAIGHPRNQSMLVFERKPVYDVGELPNDSEDQGD